MVDARWALRIAVVAGLLCTPLLAKGQPPKVYRVGVLHPAASSGLHWLKSLHAMGYVEGQNLVVERRYAAGKPERLVDLAADLVRLKVDLIVATGVAAVRLMSYGASEPALAQRVAVYVDKLLKGAKAAELPVEQPTVLEFVVNLTTAKALGVTIPQSVLIRADHVIQ